VFFIINPTWILNCTSYRPLSKTLDNDYGAAPKGTGDEKFPKDLAEAVIRVTTYKPMMTARDDTNNKTINDKKASFAQQNRSGKKEVTCFRCNKKGHLARDCKEKSKKEKETDSTTESTKTDKTNKSEGGKKAAQFMMEAINLQGSRNDYQHLRQSVLLDIQSTADIFCNLHYLTNIREVPET
jgi:hypothetical protein